MISYELNNVKQQRLILTRKLELIDNIDDQYKEQIRLLSQLVSNFGSISVNSFQSSVAFHTETSHLISNANQITGFYMRSNTEMNRIG